MYKSRCQRSRGQGKNFSPFIAMMTRKQAALDGDPHHPATFVVDNFSRENLSKDSLLTRAATMEVTQLLNSFLGALAHSWEALRADLNAMPISEALC